MNETAQRDGAPGIGGFTLVELLVSLALFGLISVMTAGSIQFGARVWERGAASTEAASDVQVVQSLLRRQLSSAAARTLSTAADDTEALFQGEAAQITFVAPFPARFAGGGLYRQRLSRDDGPDGGLRLAWQRYDPQADAEAPFAAEGSVLLLTGLTDFAVDYFERGGRGRLPGWRRRWAEDRLPAQIRVTLAFAGVDARHWPTLVVTPQSGERP